MTRRGQSSGDPGRTAFPQEAQDPGRQRGDAGSGLWFSDREIIGEGTGGLPYTSQDFRRELARVERKQFWLTFIVVVLVVIAIMALVGIVL